MNLQLSLPESLLLDERQISRVVAETPSGSFGILPDRLDCVAALVPGILMYAGGDGVAKYVAVDEGILVKAGETIQVSVRHAVVGHDLDQVRAAVDLMLQQMDEEERDARVVLARMESGFIRQFRRLRGE